MYWLDTENGAVLDAAAIITTDPSYQYDAQGEVAPSARFARLAFDDRPAFDANTHKLTQQAPRDDGGVWRVGWDVAALTPGERKARVPASVTRRQARQALLLAGLLDQVPAAIAAIPDPIQRGMAQIEWDDSQAFERHRPLLISLATTLGLNDAALDNLFIQAAKL